MKILITRFLSMVVLIMFLLPITTAFSSGIIDYTIGVNGNIISITGATSAGAARKITLLVRNSDTNVITYIGQTVSTAGGAFEFEFAMPATADSGGYTVVVGSQDTTSVVTDTFEYALNNITPTPPTSNTTTISYTVSKDNRNINITGNTTAGTDRKLTLMVRNSTTQAIAYIGQTLSGASGAFSFAFLMPENAASGEYIITIGSQDTTVAIPSSFTYTTDANTQPPSNNTVAYSITQNGRNIFIAGITTAGSGRQITIIVRNAESQAIAFLGQTISETNGAFSFAFLMPEGAVSGNYSVNVGSKDSSASANDTFEYEATNGTPSTAQITYSVMVNARNISINGTTSAGLGRSITLFVRNASSQSIAFIGQTVSGVNGAFSFAFLMPENAVSGQYNVTIGSQDTSVSVTDSFDYTSQSTQDEEYVVDGEINIACTIGEEVEVVLRGNNIRNFADKVFRVEFDGNCLEVIDCVGSTLKKDLGIGKANYSRITILSISANEIEFSVDKNIVQGFMWSGTINVIKFKAKQNVTTPIIFE